jgi:glyoxylase-like metal-dependent hydrolase (beta-lactamase superfamily II)
MFRVDLLPTPVPVTRIRMAKSLLGRPLHGVSAYRIGDLLIDSGPPPTAGRLVEWCRDAMEHGELSRVVLTHHHEDHVGGAAALQRELGLPVVAPASAVPILAEGLRMPLYRRLVWSAPERFRARGLGDEVTAGDLRFRVVPTPGHAFTHVCLWEPDRRWLFSGNLYVHPRVQYLRRIEDAWEHIASLRRVRALEPELMICSHAGLVDEPVRAIERKIAWWEGLAADARALRARGWSIRRITRRLLGREGLFFYFSLGDFAKRNLVRSLLQGANLESTGGRA